MSSETIYMIHVTEFADGKKGVTLGIYPLTDDQIDAFVQDFKEQMSSLGFSVRHGGIPSSSIH